MSDEEAAPEEEPHFLSDPDVGSAFDLMMSEFLAESDRGAVLIAADIVSEHLGLVLTALKPDEFTPKRMKTMLSYPGLVASFSARADVCLIAGFIDANAYRAIMVLKRIRNAAAHSQANFRLADLKDDLRALSDLGPGTAVAVNRFARDLLLRNVIENLRERGVELEAEIGSNPFSSPAEILEELSKRPDAMDQLESKAPRMELAFGVWLLLGLIAHRRKDLEAKRAAKVKPEK